MRSTCRGDEEVCPTCFACRTAVSVGEVAAFTEPVYAWSGWTSCGYWPSRKEEAETKLLEIHKEMTRKVPATVD